MKKKEEPKESIKDIYKRHTGLDWNENKLSKFKFYGEGKSVIAVDLPQFTTDQCRNEIAVSLGLKGKLTKTELLDNNDEVAQTFNH